MEVNVAMYFVKDCPRSPTKGVFPGWDAVSHKCRHCFTELIIIGQFLQTGDLGRFHGVGR